MTAPAPSHGRARLALIGGYALVVLIWGTTWYGVHTQVNGTEPHVAVALRLAVSSVIFFGIALALKLPLRISRRQVGLVTVQGICFFGMNYVAVYTASQYLTSGVLAVVFSITVPFNIVVDRIINRRRARPLVIVAALTGVAGIAVVFSGELERALATANAVWGATLGVFAATIVAVGNVLASGAAATELGPVRLSAFGLAAGTIAIMLWGLVTGAPWTLDVTPEWLAGYAYLVLIGSVVAFGIYMRILPMIGPVAGAYVVVLSPAVAIGISALLEGLPLGPTTLVGVAMLLAGHSMLISERRHAATETSIDSTAKAGRQEADDAATS
jgi:drug/metabolite transporter (DMT)-like permease